MKKLVITGAGGFGREMFAAARECAGYGEDFLVAGFLDAKPSALDGFPGYGPVLGDPLLHVPSEDEIFIVALGGIPARRACVAALEAKGAKFATLVHRRANVGPNVKIGPGSYIAPGVSLTADIEIGSHTDVFHNTSVGHDARIGSFAHVYAQCAIGGGVEIGDGAQVFPGAVVVPRRKIGADAVVGAGSVVILDVPSNARVFGNPARPLS